MPSTRFPIANIAGYMPSIEGRLLEETRVINGRNFTWDSKGPKSGFGDVILTPFPISKPRDIQSIRIQGRSLTFTQDAIMSWRTSVPNDWELLHLFTTELQASERFPWQVIYLSGYLYLSHPYRGFYEAELLTGQTKLWIRPKIVDDIPGLPQEIKGMVVVRGRAILVNDEYITWSSVGDLTNLTPSLGGAGFQRIDGVVSGTYVGVTSYQQGFIVWTTKGAIIAEYIGGDEVWRFDAMIGQERPLSAWCVIELSSGMTAMLTSHGMFVSPDSPQPWTNDFNEFFREYYQHRPQSQHFFRLDYDADAETVYVLESESGSIFHRTFVLKPTLNKWGLFDVATYGMGQLTHEDFGYVRYDGIPKIFADVYYREEEPPVELGRDRHRPRIQKQMIVPSSTLRSRALTWTESAPGEIRDVNSPGWFDQESFIAASPCKGPMDSWVEIGYLRSGAMNMAADAYAEFQEITVHSIPTQPTYPVDFTTQYREDFFHPVIEDWNYATMLVESDIIFDLLTESGEEDWMTDSFYEDWLHTSEFETMLDPEVEIEDWDLDGEGIDLNGTAGDYPAIDWNLTIHASQDGITVDDYVPDMAKFGIGSKEYSTLTSGSLHYLRFEATAVNQWYAVHSLDLTMLYGGQQS